MHRVAGLHNARDVISAILFSTASTCHRRSFAVKWAWSLTDVSSGKYEPYCRLLCACFLCFVYTFCAPYISGSYDRFRFEVVYDNIGFVSAAVGLWRVVHDSSYICQLPYVERDRLSYVCYTVLTVWFVLPNVCSWCIIGTGRVQVIRYLM